MPDPSSPAKYKQTTLIIDCQQYVSESFISLNDVIMLTEYLTSRDADYCRAVADLIHSKIICEESQRPSVDQIATQDDVLFVLYISELEFKSATEMIDCINMNEEGGLSFDNWGASILFNWYQTDGNQVTAIKQDIPLFIDYLFPLIEKKDSQLLEVIKNIEQNIYANTSIYSKYRWVADYLKALDISGQKSGIIIGGEETYRLYNI